MTDRPVSFDVEIARAKHAQAAGMLEAHGLDCWVVQFGRETGLVGTTTDHLVGSTVTWPSAFLINRDGRTAALVGSGDVSKFEGMGLWQDVRGYRESVEPDLLDVLRAWGASRVGVGFSLDDHGADTITHGMFLRLQALLAPHTGPLLDAGPLAADLRREKLPVELERLREALRRVEDLHRRVPELLAAGSSERDVHHAVKGWVRDAGWAFAGDEELNPIVNIGPLEGVGGHTLPGDRRPRPGDLVHVDMAVAVNGYAADLQRTWYCLRPGESGPPEALQAAVDTLVAAIDAGVAAMRPGVQGHEVDAAARRVIVDAGHPTPPFAFGHHVGRVAHDGGGMLAPLWPRYGDSPRFRLRAGQIFAVEFLLNVAGHGVLGLEEEVLITETGSEMLSHQQRALRLLREEKGRLVEFPMEAAR